MTDTQFAAVLGFAFVAAWIAFGFGAAILCLVGAIAFYMGALFLRGDLDLAEIRSRLGGRQAGVGRP